MQDTKQHHQKYKTDIRDGMAIDWDVPIEMDDDVVLKCDVYRPIEPGRYPVIMSYGPYGKWLHFEDMYGDQWRRMCEQHPDVPAGSTNKYQQWEVVDPEKWVPDGYVCIRVDSRGAGRSPGVIDIWSLREAQDLAICVDWAGVQTWSNGKVGLNGISYYAENQWQTAALQPKHLAAICTWEGAADYYRDMAWHGGIFCRGFVQDWSIAQVYSVQHGRGKRGFRSRMNGDWVSGPGTLREEELGQNRRDFYQDCLANKLDTDEFWQSRMPDWSKVKVPLLSSANWGGQGLHPRGNFEGFVRAASKEKWLEVHGIEHWTHFYTDYGVNLQKRFFGHFLKGDNTDWQDQPKVQLQVRHPGEKFVERFENEWPLARTQWTKFYLHPETKVLSATSQSVDGSVTYGGFSDGVTFLTEPLAESVEITGPIAAKIWVSSTTEDADLFLVVRVFAPDMKEVTFQGALDPHTPIAQGWLRVSHRKLDETLTLPYRPYHSHDEIQLLNPGDVSEVDVEVWPTCIVVPSGYRLGLSVRGTDYVYPGDSGGGLGAYANWTGCGIFKHDDPNDRPAHIFGGDVTLHTGAKRQAFVLLPIIPTK
ncbi:MAG: CocE/NonD family hydrolase [Gammaproteobacteria bacterium]|nr:CocE/NonD family hydrolase [Gammaproteobacteria bacterium]MDH3410952.1 CocE/NonD family hydrolase [Gammaproteobacteria bacterium]